MKIVLFIILFLLTFSCSKPKTVLICGDHVCVNKEEAKQFFEENLTLEVRIIDKKKNKTNDLVELNLNKNNVDQRKVSIVSKKNTKKDLKKLSKEEINRIKKNIKVKKNERKIVKIIDKSEDIKNKSSQDFIKRDVNKIGKNVVDVCTILKKCSIDEISKYLLEQGAKKDFPDITRKQ